MIPYGRQSLDDDDVRAVLEVLSGDFLTQGPHIAAFEDALAATVGARHTVAFSSGTAALHAATAAAGLGPDDRVVTSPLSFVASANCARSVGAEVDFADIEPTTLNLDLARLPPGLDTLVPVHFAGLPVDLSRLPYRPRIIIEDAAHALGATSPDGPVGNCARSDLCVFSFHPVKAITTGEGGAVTTNDAELATSLRRFRHHGIVPKPEHGGWYYEVETIGHNFRITDIQAALGRSQLAKLPSFIARRTALAERYRQRLSGTGVTLPPWPREGFSHAWHLFPIQVDRRRQVFDGLRAAGIGVQVHYVPIYAHPPYGGGARREEFPTTEQVYGRLLSLPLFPTLSETDQDRVIERLLELLRAR